MENEDLNNNPLELLNVQVIERNARLVKILQYKTERSEELLDYALSEAIELTKSKIGYIYLYNEKTKVFTLNSWSKSVMEACLVAEKSSTYNLVETGFWGEVVRQRKPIVNNAFTKKNSLKKGIPEGHVGVTRFLSIPIYDQQHIVAVLGVGNKEENYDSVDVQQLQILMENVWQAVKRKEAEVALKVEKERLRITLESIGDGVIAVDRKGNIQLLNAVAETLTEWTFEEAYGQPLELVYKLEEEATREPIKDLAHMAMLSSSLNKMDKAVLLISKSGKEYPISDSNTPILDDLGGLNGAVLVFRDISLERKREASIRYISYHDVLTGLYNRRFFEEELQRLDTKRQLPISIIMGDVNGLKLTNDIFGHLEGDRLLRQAATIMKVTCREEDIVARWGGDEFIVLLPKTPEYRAREICQSIMETCALDDTQVVNTSISLGFATKMEENEDVATIIKKAEDFMYKHKLTEGRSQRSNLIASMQNSLLEKSHETEAHASRLKYLCQVIGTKMGIQEEWRYELELLAVLHDIGKIGIKDSILNKPGGLNPEEWKEMRRHPEIGYRIAQASPELVQIAEYILTHHERWDAQGYPRGLEGKDIPLLSRILAVVDAYDAMTSDRPYRKAMPKDEAILELIKNAGTQFDPEVVSAFVGEIMNIDFDEKS